MGECVDVVWKYACCRSKGFSCNFGDEQVIALSTLGSTTLPHLLQRTLDFGIGEGVRPQDIIYVIGSVASNPIGLPLAWEFVKVFLFTIIPFVPCFFFKF